MQAHAADPDVFIRSMATRGHLGGLARTTSDAALVLDAAGKSVVIVETVGVGQDEVDIVRTADVSVVVLVPGTGDDVQALKAGIMEIADVYVVNKADRDGADRMVTSIESNLALQAYPEGAWRPPIVKTEATTGARRARAVAGDSRRSSPIPRRDRPRRRAARHEYRLRELLAQRFLAHVEQAVFAPGRVRRAGRAHRARARSIRTRAAADVLGAGPGGEGGVVKVRLDHVGIAVADAAGGGGRGTGPRSGWRSRTAEEVAVAAGAGPLPADRRGDARAAREHRADLADCPVPRAKRGPGPAPRRAGGRRHPRRAGRAASRPACGWSTRRRGPAPRARWSPSSIRRRRRACWSS